MKLISGVNRMFPKGQMANLMRQAQQMNEKMQAMQAQLAEIEVSGDAAAGMVRITLNGAKQITAVSISDEALEDKDMLEDLIIAAYNNAHTNIEEKIQQKTQQVTQGMGLPAGMKLPF